MRAAVVGGAGYAGGELLRILAGHPCVEVTQVTSERLAGRRVDTVHPPLRGRELAFIGRDSLESADVVFAALEHGESSRVIDQLRATAPLVIDMGADFRLRDPAAYDRWYGWRHPRPELLSGAVYGLAELHRDCIGAASLIATGGCLATAGTLALLPLARAGVIDRSAPLVIDAMVGSSAGGATPGPATHHAHRSGELRSYAPTGHRHTAEIAQELCFGGAGGPEVAFSATSVEAVRGVLVTAHVFLTDDLAERDVWRLYRARYADEPFVRIVKSSTGLHRSPNPKLLSGTNFCDVGFERDPHSRRLVVTAALDNLVKGAAGQAVQALNIRCGWDETTGLEFTGIYPL